jgi:preprotein translocase subunit SecB
MKQWNFSPFHLSWPGVFNRKVNGRTGQSVLESDSFFLCLYVTNRQFHDNRVMLRLEVEISCIYQIMRANHTQVRVIIKSIFNYMSSITTP